MGSNKKFNLIKAVRSLTNNEPFTGTELEVITAGREEMRLTKLPVSNGIHIPSEARAVISAGGANSGKEGISEQKLGLIEPLRSSLVCVQAGATFLSGLVGNVSIPTYSGTTALWKGEVAAADDGAGTTDEVTLSPKRLTTFIDVSKQFLLQDSVGASAFLMTDLIRAISDKLEATIFGTVAGNATQPGGFFASLPIAPYIGSVTWDKIVSLETAVATANALTTAKYITNAAGRGLLKSTLKVANSPTYLMDPDGTVNGYPVLVTNHMPGGLQGGADENGIIFADWSQYIVAQWGSVELTVDPYSQAPAGCVRLTVNAYFDAKPRQAASFKTGTIKA